MDAPPDLASVPAAAAPESRWARHRLRAAVCLLLSGAGGVIYHQVLALRAYPAVPYRFDPGVVFYLAGAVGLMLRVFWARWLAISFSLAILTVNVFWGQHPLAALAAVVPFITLLTGRSMRALFEGRAGGRNPWAVELDRRVARLRALFLAQSVALAMIWPATLPPSPGVLAFFAAAGVALAGLVMQRAWAALLAAVVVALEAAFALRSIGHRVHWGAPPAWTFPGLLLVACAVSLAVLGPLLAAMLRKLRGAG